jgi:hypothetical protein
MKVGTGFNLPKVVELCAFVNMVMNDKYSVCTYESTRRHNPEQQHRHLYPP